jgi:hypothetical protein
MQIAEFALGANMDAHPSLPRVLIGNYGAGGSLGVIDVEKMQVVARVDRNSTSANFTSDGRRVIELSGDSLLIEDAATLRPLGSVRGTADIASGGIADSERGYFLSSDASGLSVWNVLTGRRIHSWKSLTRLHSAIRDDPHAFLTSRNSAGAAGDSVTEMVIARTDSFSTKPLLRTGLKVTAHSISRNLLALGGPQWRDTAGAMVRVEIYDRASNALVNSFSVQATTAYLEYRQVYRSGVTDLAISPEGKRIALATYWQDGFGHPLTYSHQVRVFDLSTGTLSKSFELNDDVLGLSWVKADGDSLEVTTNRRTYVYNASTGAYTGSWRERTSTEREIKLSNGVVRWTASGLWLESPGSTSKRISSRYRLVDVEVFEKQNLLLTQNQPNEIDLYDLKSLTRQLTIVSKRDGEWIAYAPTGEFVSSLVGTEKVFWSLGDQMLPFDALKNRFEKPGIIAERLAAIAGGSSVATVTATPTIAPDAFAEDPYSISVASRDQSTGGQAFVVEFTVRKKHPDLGDVQLAFRQQGLELPKDSAASRLVSTRLADGSTSFKRTFDLAAGMNVIDIDYVFGGVTRRGTTVRINRQREIGAEPAPTHLWFLGIGTAKYANSEFNLQFASKDARDVAREFKAQEGKLYSKVDTLLLLDSSATNQNIKIQLHEFLGRASSQDMIVIYLSGHGAEDNSKLYYMPHEGDLRRPYTGFEISAFQEFLRSRPPSQKALFFVDICHAGNQGPLVKGGLTSLTGDEAQKQLAEGTGVVVLASSSGQENSLEDPSYGTGNGAFTAAVLELLSGKADDKVDVVTVQRLMSFVFSRVPEITKGRQHPVTPDIRNLQDFPIARRGRVSAVSGSR